MEAKVRALPLFPLNVVLFPGQTLPLHIFEPRYRIMIRRCIENDEPFGVVLARDEEPDEPHEIGTSARVTDAKRLSDGRMNILTLGEERFRLRDFRVSEHGYLIGNVVPFPFIEDVTPADALVNTVSQRLARYLKLLGEANGLSFRFDQFPTRPVDVAVFTAIAMRLPLDQKQFLLSQEHVSDLLAIESDLLREELKMMHIVASAIRPPEDGLFFSRN
ncbi:MAG: LON peptidase substrate-binding domain-containing protein [Thermoflexales bacterium]|nr:LON peptidase substrate-binding domain-containing protein [Thermoflexales bacterium]MDW8351635.1 LON peptidase substrate-binding domain-containing protein [Anaerolineae bacterium]